MKILLNGYLNLLPPRNGHHYGGPQSFTNSFINYLNKKTNHSFTAIILRSNKNLKNDQLTIKNFKEGKNNWTIIGSNLKIKKIIQAKNTTLPSGYKKIINKLAKHLKKIQPDVIILNGFSVPSWYLLKAASQIKRPIIASHHGLWFKDIAATGRLYTPAGKKLGWQMEKDISRLADKQIFLNTFSQKTFTAKIKSNKIAKANYLNLPYNPIYLNKLKPVTNKNFKIGLVGRWDNIKNHQAFLKLAKLAKIKKLPWEFYSVTHWSTDKPLNNFQKNYQKHIKLVKQMSPANLKKFYQSMNLMVLPSRFDVSPTVVMEAALQNRQTIISNYVGWIDVYKKFGLNKLITDFNKPNQIIKLIKNNLGQPVPQKFYNYIKTEHHPDKVFKKYLALITGTIK